MPIGFVPGAAGVLSTIIKGVLITVLIAFLFNFLTGFFPQEIPGIPLADLSLILSDIQNFIQSVIYFTSSFLNWTLISYIMLISISLISFGFIWKVSMFVIDFYKKL